MGDKGKSIKGQGDASQLVVHSPNCNQNHQGAFKNTGSAGPVPFTADQSGQDLWGWCQAAVLFLKAPLWPGI